MQRQEGCRSREGGEVTELLLQNHLPRHQSCWAEVSVLQLKQSSPGQVRSTELERLELVHKMQQLNASTPRKGVPFLNPERRMIPEQDTHLEHS